jgi:predicted Zn-dependent protease
MRNYKWIMGLACACFLFESCAVNPVSGKKQVVFMSEAQEIAMGQQADPEIVAYFGLYEDAALQKFINEKGQQMAAVSHRPNLKYEFKIVDSPVLNAFAVPGGYVYFTRGIMAHFNNEAEFAGVLGHEIGHITARHTVIQQRNAMLGQIGLIAGVVLVPELAQFAEPLSAGVGLALLSFGREAERQSDELGVEYATKINYDAVEMAEFFKTLERQSEKSGGSSVPEFLSTHPSPAGRYATVKKLAEEWRLKVDLENPKVNRNEYLKLIDGLVYGEDPRQGFQEDGKFYHPELKFEFPVPTNWNLQNSPSMVQMAPKDGKAIINFSLSQSTSLSDAATKVLEQYKLERIESNAATVNGLEALVLVADQKQEQLTIRTLTYFIKYGNYIYQIMGITSATDYNTLRPVFLGTMQNFKELKDAEKLNRKPDRVKIKTLTQAGTLAESFQRFNQPDSKFDELAILNGMLLSDRLQAGTLIKVIER